MLLLFLNNTRQSLCQILKLLCTVEKSPARKGINTRNMGKNPYVLPYNHQAAVWFISVRLSDLLKWIPKPLDKTCPN